MQIAGSEGRRGEQRNGWRRRLQESKLGDFEFQSIKLLAFRRAVVAAATAVVVRSLPLSLHLPLSLSPLALFPLAPFPLFLPLRPPSFFPRILPPRTVALRLKYIPMYLQPPRSYPTLVVLQLPPPALALSPPLFFPFLFPPFCRGSSSATHESARIHTRVRSRAFSGRSRTHAEYNAP